MAKDQPLHGYRIVACNRNTVSRCGISRNSHQQGRAWVTKFAVTCGRRSIGAGRIRIHWERTSSRRFFPGIDTPLMNVLASVSNSGYTFFPRCE